MVMTHEELELTKKQLNAAKSVYRAIRKAGKLGVHFWDNYGTLQAYNVEKISCPVPDKEYDISLQDVDPTYYEVLNNFHAGNADDDLYFNQH